MPPPGLGRRNILIAAGAGTLALSGGGAWALTRDAPKRRRDEDDEPPPNRVKDGASAR